MQFFLIPKDLKTSKRTGLKTSVGQWGRKTNSLPFPQIIQTSKAMQLKSTFLLNNVKASRHLWQQWPSAHSGAVSTVNIASLSFRVGKLHPSAFIRVTTSWKKAKIILEKQTVRRNNFRIEGSVKVTKDVKLRLKE